MISMKEPPPPPPLLRRKKPTAATHHSHYQPKKLKLVCSFNGAFHPQPPSGALRYAGGEIRIVSVDRNFSFSKLHSKITDLAPGIASFVIKYQLPDSGSSSGAAPLLRLDSDDDVRRMVDAFEKLECCGKSARLRLFVCGTSHVNGVGSGTRTRVEDEKEAKNNNESLRKMVLMQQLMAKQSGSGLGLGRRLGDMELAKKCEAYEPLLIDLDPECDNVARFSAARCNALNHRDGNVRVDQALGKVLCNGRNVADQSNSAMQGLKPVNCAGVKPGFDVEKKDREKNEIGSRNRENIMHRGANCGLVQNGLSGDSLADAGDRVCCSIRNHRFGGKDARHQRYIPYCVRNHRINIAEMGKDRTVRLNGRLSTMKCCIGLGPHMSIRKQGQAVSISSNNGSNDIQDSCNGGTCSVNISLRNLSLSKEVEGPQVKESQGIASEPSFQTSAKIVTKSEHVDEDREDAPSSLCFTEEANHGDSLNCSKVIGGTSNDLAAFYTHLATRELQTIKNSDLEFIKELGSGTYGTVYHGKWKGSNVAIKKIKPSCFTDGVLEDRLLADFWKEAHILGQLHHPNIVAFYGVVTDGPLTNLATVTEYMVNGSLQQVLRRKDRTIDRRKRLILAMDAAFGMEYLHAKSIVHFDLKSHNFLVNMKDPQRPVCKIGDLGLSKIKQRTLISGGVRGTVPWMAPELLNSNNKNNLVTEKVDVYSFGIVMWELLTGEEPYANLRSEEIIVGIIKGNLRPEIPSWCDPTWRSLMKRCWLPDPKSRPPFSEISKELRAMSAAMNIN